MSLLLDSVSFQGLIEGRSILSRVPVLLATTANITLSGNQTIDNVLTNAGDRVLVKNQTDAKQNGIYIASIGSWSRAQDFPMGQNVAGISMYVTSGTLNSKTIFYCNNFYGSDVVGTDSITFDVYMTNDKAQSIFNKSFVDSSTTFYNVSTDAKTLFSLSNISTGQTRTFKLPNGLDGTLITTNTPFNTSNKTFDDATTYLADNVDSTKRAQFQASGISSGSTRTFTIQDSDMTLVLDSLTQTINSNGSFPNYFTLPKINELKNTSGEKMVEFGSVPSAVNYLEMKSYIDSSSRVDIAAIGTSTDIPVKLKTKGSGTIDIKKTDDSTAGIHYPTKRPTGGTVQSNTYIDVSSSLNTNISITLPSIASTKKKVLRMNASNQIEYSTDRVTYTLSSTSHILSSTPFLIPSSIFAWNNAYYGTSGDFKFEEGYATYIYVADLAAIGRTITVNIYNTTASTVLGTSTTTVTLSGTYPIRFGFTLPTADAILQYRASASGIGGNISLFAGSLDFGDYTGDDFSFDFIVDNQLNIRRNGTYVYQNSTIDWNTGVHLGSFNVKSGDVVQFDIVNTASGSYGLIGQFTYKNITYYTNSTNFPTLSIITNPVSASNYKQYPNSSFMGGSGGAATYTVTWTVP